MKRAIEVNREFVNSLGKSFNTNRRDIEAEIIEMMKVLWCKDLYDLKDTHQQIMADSMARMR